MFSLLLMLAVSQTACFSQASSAPEQILENSEGKAATRKEGGLMLDTARHFYTMSVIKDFIDTLARSGGSFLHLHFSDNENYALESRILNQRAEDARVNEEGIYINPVTGKPFLSFAQLDELKAYAKAKNIELIPELDSPSHMDAIFMLLANTRGKSYVHSLKS